MEFKLTKKQWETYKALASWKYKEILVWWGWSGWKSRWIACIVTITCLQYGWISRLVGRDNLKKLKQSTRLTFLKVRKEYWIIKDVDYTVNMAEFVVDFKNGSKIFFVDLWRYPSDPFYDRIWSMELTYSRLEEWQEIDSMVSDTISWRYRQAVKEYNIDPCTIITCNPKKGYLYERFITPNIKDHRLFIPILYSDNPHIDQKKYAEWVLASGNKIQIERLLHWNRDYDDTPWKLYAYDDLLNMRHNPLHNGKKYISIDWATEWDDLAVLMVWDGWEVKEIITREKSTTTQISTKARELCQRYGIPLSHIVNDHIGIWAGISHELGKIYQYASWSKPIVKKWEPKPYNHLRDQCFFEIQKHIHKIKFPDTKRKDMIVEELDVMRQIDIDKDWPYKVIKKDDIKAKIGRSPNFADAISQRCVFELKQENKYLTSFV